jgi:hypothetical protein
MLMSPRGCPPDVLAAAALAGAPRTNPTAIEINAVRIILGILALFPYKTRRNPAYFRWLAAATLKIGNPRWLFALNAGSTQSSSTDRTTRGVLVLAQMQSRI